MSKKNKFFEDLKKSLEEVIAYQKGELDLYSEYIEIPEPPIKEDFRALEDTLLPQFSFHSKPGTPSKGTEDGDETVQDERD